MKEKVKELDKTKDVDLLVQNCLQLLNMALDKSTPKLDEGVAQSLVQQALRGLMWIGYRERYDMRNQEIELAYLGLELARTCHDKNDTILLQFLHALRGFEKDPIKLNEVENEFARIKAANPEQFK